MAEPSSNKPSLVPPWMWFALLGCVAVSGVLVAIFHTASNQLAAWGSLLQGIAGSVALVLVWRTLDLQREELIAQREEMKLQRVEFEKGNLQTERLADNAILQAKLLQEQMDRPIQPFLNFYRADDDVRVKNDGQGYAYEVRVTWSLDGKVIALKELVARVNQDLGGPGNSAGQDVTDSMMPQGHTYALMTLRRGGWAEPKWFELAPKITLRIDCNDLRQRPLTFQTTLDRLRPPPRHA